MERVGTRNAGSAYEIMRESQEHMGLTSMELMWKRLKERGMRKDHTKLKKTLKKNIIGKRQIYFLICTFPYHLGSISCHLGRGWEGGKAVRSGMSR